MNLGAREILAAERKSSPRVHDLARHLALAARIEPGLLRRARRRLHPRAAPDLEADLWNGPLVATRNPLELVLRADVVALLREELARDAAALEVAWDLVRRAHADAPEALRLQEEITYLGLRGDDEARAAFETLLRRLIASLVAREDKHGLVEWVRRALPHLPAGVRESEAARMLAAGAEAHGASAPVDGVRVGAAESARWRGWLAPAAPPTRTLGLRWTRRGLLLREPEEGDAPLAVPDEARVSLTLRFPLVAPGLLGTADAPSWRSLELELPPRLPHLVEETPGAVHLASAVEAAWVRPGETARPTLVVSAPAESELWGWDPEGACEELGWSLARGYRQGGWTPDPGGEREAVLYVLEGEAEPRALEQDLSAAGRDGTPLLFLLPAAALDGLPWTFQQRFLAPHRGAILGGDSPAQTQTARVPVLADWPRLPSMGEARRWLQARLAELDRDRARAVGRRRVLLVGDLGADFFSKAVRALLREPPDDVVLERVAPEDGPSLRAELEAIATADAVHVLAAHPGLGTAFAFGYARSRARPVRLLVPRGEGRDRPWNRPLFAPALTEIDPDPVSLGRALAAAGSPGESAESAAPADGVLVLGTTQETEAAGLLEELAAGRRWSQRAKGLEAPEEIDALLDGVGRVVWLSPTALPVDDDAYLDAAVAGRALGLGLELAVLVDRGGKAAGDVEPFAPWTTVFHGTRDLERAVDEVTRARRRPRVLVAHAASAGGASALIEEATKEHPELEIRALTSDLEPAPDLRAEVEAADRVLLLQDRPDEWLIYLFGLAAGLGKPAGFAVAALDPSSSLGPMAPPKGLPHRVVTESFDLGQILAVESWTDAYDEAPAPGPRQLVVLHDASEARLHQVLSEASPDWIPEPPDWDPRDLRETFDGVGRVAWVIPEPTPSRDEASALRGLLAAGYAHGLGLPVLVFAQDGLREYDWLPGFEARKVFADAEDLGRRLHGRREALERWLELLRDRGPARHHGEPYDPSRHTDLGVVRRRVEHDATATIPGEGSLAGALAEARGGSVVLVGWAGAGKTWALAHLLETLLDPEAGSRAVPGGEPILPIWIDLASFRAGAPSPFERVAGELGADAPPGLAELLEEEARAGRAVLLLDGADHVPGPDRPALADWLDGLVRRHPRLRCVLALREDEPDLLPGAERVWIARPTGLPPGLEERRRRARGVLRHLERDEEELL